MGKVIWNNKVLLEFEESHKQLLLASCNSKNIKYILNEENIVMFPALYDKTIIVNIISNDEKLKKEIQSIESTLSLEGAAVIIDNGNATKQTIRYLDAQILLSFSVEENIPDLTIYLPFVNDRTSLSITKKLLKYLSLSESSLNYKVASFWEKIAANRYWNYLWGNPLPTMVLEAGIPNISSKTLSILKSSLVKSIIEELGEKPSSEEIKIALNFIEKSKETIDFETKIKNEEQAIQLNELLEKLKHQESELNSLKKCYRETEDELKRIKEVNENEIINTNETMPKTKAKKKNNKRVRSKKIYFPISAQKEKDKSMLYSKLAYPIKIPEGGPIYQFRRPQKGTSNSITVPSYLNPATLTRHNIKHHPTPKSANIQKIEVPPAQTSCQDIIENLKGLNTAQEK
ncbi:hypothetical protein [Desulfitibacter alkalitolerans]|uniref:hypothetical protein n=1 Tax=Desulfitibacter alkalitolerans TaxID=264641 RepID=UPI000489C1D7|nr:hypothetical protein [Desulfitibacter alkalitolerans]